MLLFQILINSNQDIILAHYFNNITGNELLNVDGAVLTYVDKNLKS